MNVKKSYSIQVIGLIFFGILFYFSWHFYKERMLAFDGALSDFLLIMGGRPIAGIGRYGDWLPLLIPWLLFKLNSPLSVIVLAHSVSFIIIHYLIFLFITLKLKNYGAGIATMLVSCLSYYHAFYNPMVELNESLVAGVLLWALIHQERKGYVLEGIKKNIIASLLVIGYMSFLHPLGVFVVGFVLGIEMIGERRYRDYSLWIIAVVGLGWFVLKPLMFPEPYDQSRILPFHELISHASEWKTWPSTHFYSDYTRLHFRILKWLGAICLLLSLRKSILLFLFSLLYVAAYAFLLLANFQQGTAAMFYEDYYIVFGFFIGLLLIYLIYNSERRKLVLLLMLPLLFSGLKRIYKAHNLYSDRLAYLERMVKQAHSNDEKKCLVDSKCYPFDYALTPWDFAFETLVYSSLNSPDSSVSVFIKTDDVSRLCDSLQNSYNVFFGVHYLPISFKPSKMPARYFKLPSASGYQYLTHSQEDSSFHEEIYSVKNIKIAPLKQSIVANTNEWGYTSIPVEIINTSGHYIPAIPRSKNPVLISIKLSDEKGNTVFDFISNALESDIINKADCGVTLPLLAKKGTYYAKIDMMTDGVREWNLNCPVVKVIFD